MDSIGLKILLQVVLIALNAVFACAEIAVISMNDNKRVKMAAEGDYYAYDDVEENAHIKSIGENTWKIHGSALLEDVSEKLGVTLYCEDFDTFNGLIFHTLGKVPADGGKFTLEIKNLSVKVAKVQNHMVEVAIVTKKEVHRNENKGCFKVRECFGRALF